MDSERPRRLEFSSRIADRRELHGEGRAVGSCTGVPSSPQLCTHRHLLCNEEITQDQGKNPQKGTNRRILRAGPGISYIPPNQHEEILRRMLSQWWGKINPRLKMVCDSSCLCESMRASPSLIRSPVLQVVLKKVSSFEPSRVNSLSSCDLVVIIYYFIPHYPKAL